MKKYIGAYTAYARKAIKHADKINCMVCNDGTIYITSGAFMFKMDAFEYATIAQPITFCEAGNWTIDRNGKHEENNQFSAEQIFAAAVKETQNVSPMKRSPIRIDDQSDPLIGFYNTDHSFASFYKSSYMDSIIPGATIKTKSSSSVAVAYFGDEPFALIMPFVRAGENAARAVKAYFTD